MDFPNIADAAQAEQASRSGETVERIADELKAGILNSHFSPGQRLIARDVAEQYNVSRNSLREAFRRLEADGLVDIIPNRGAVVRRISPAEVLQVFQIREALEGSAARMAAQRIDDGDNRERFIEVLHRGRRHRARPILQDFIVDNRAFHQSIVGLSGNPMMSALIDKYQLPVLMVQLRQVISTEQVISKALDEHEAIAEAILSGQPDAASQAMRYHLWRSTKQILSLADVTLQPSPAVMDEMADLLSLKND